MYWFIPVSCLVRIVFALMQWSIVSKVTIGGASSTNGGSSGRHHPSHGHHSQHLLDSEDGHDECSTVSKANEVDRSGIHRCFLCSGAVTGFLLAANDLLVLFIAIALSKLYFGEDRVGLYESINDYGLKGARLKFYLDVSAVAFFTPRLRMLALISQGRSSRVFWKTIRGTLL